MLYRMTLFLEIYVKLFDKLIRIEKMIFLFINRQKYSDILFLVFMICFSNYLNHTSFVTSQYDISDSKLQQMTTDHIFCNNDIQA